MLSTSIALEVGLGKSKSYAREAQVTHKVVDTKLAGIIGTVNELDKLCKRQAESETSVQQVAAKLNGLNCNF